MNQGMAEPMGNALPNTVQLQPSNLLAFRLRKLTREVADKISVRTEIFELHRTTEDFLAAMDPFPMFLVTYMAVAWSIYIADCIPEEDARIYSTRYLDLDVNEDSFLNILVGQAVEKGLLPDYRLGFLVALLKACHMTDPMDAKKRLWREFVSQLSNLFASTSAYTEFGMACFEEFSKEAMPAKHGLRG